MKRPIYRDVFVLSAFEKFIAELFLIVVPILVAINLTLIYLIHSSYQNVRRSTAHLYSTMYAPHYIKISIPREDMVGKYVKPNFSLCIRNEPEVEYHMIFEKQKLDYDHLFELTKQIATEIPEIRSEENFIKLIVETAIAETFGGLFFDTTNQGGLGLTQVNYQTAKDLLLLLSKTKPNIHEKVMTYFKTNLSLKENLIHNLSFNIAMCISYYYFNVGDSLYSHINSLDKRANLWKTIYNTPLGKGTPELYIQRVKEF